MHPTPSRSDLSDQQPRWLALVTYRTSNGPLEVDHVLHELSDLHDLIERGPNWDSILTIAIQRIEPIHRGLTVEQAEAL